MIHVQDFYGTTMEDVFVYLDENGMSADTFSVQRVQQFFGCTMQCIYRRIRKGELKKKKFLITKNELAKFIFGMKVKHQDVEYWNPTVTDLNYIRSYITDCFSKFARDYGGIEDLAMDVWIALKHTPMPLKRAVKMESVIPFVIRKMRNKFYGERTI